MTRKHVRIWEGMTRVQETWPPDPEEHDGGCTCCPNGAAPRLSRPLAPLNLWAPALLTPGPPRLGQTRTQCPKAKVPEVVAR